MFTLHLPLGTYLYGLKWILTEGEKLFRGWHETPHLWLRYFIRELYHSLLLSPD